MRKFNIKVNGRLYEVEVEEVGVPFTGGVSASPQISQSPSKAVPVQETQEQKVYTQEARHDDRAHSPEKVLGGQTVSCPLPGTIIDIRVVEGDMVKRGQVLMILDAMKMENEIMSPKDGRVAQIRVSKGDTPGAGDILAVIE